MLAQDCTRNAVAGHDESVFRDRLLAAMCVDSVRADKTDVAERLVTRPSPLECFVICCWARAYLYAAGEMSLHEAVDVLQEEAEASGLVYLLGQDAVQALMAHEFGGR